MSLLWTRAASGQEFYHGTVQSLQPGDHVLPAHEHGGAVMFPHDTDHAYAYATPHEDNAWDYAERAWQSAGLDHPHFGNPPKVYRVRSLGDHEPDPTHDATGRQRGNFDTDVRSKHGFEVMEEMPMPEHMGEPEEWR